MHFLGFMGIICFFQKKMGMNFIDNNQYQRKNIVIKFIFPKYTHILVYILKHSMQVLASSLKRLILLIVTCSSCAVKWVYLGLNSSKRWGILRIVRNVLLLDNRS